MLPPYQIIDTPDRNLQRVQNQLLAPMTALLRCPLLDGRIMKDVAIAATSTAVNHGLGRSPLGWIVISNDTLATVREDSRTSAQFNLTASAACTVDLWVF